MKFSMARTAGAVLVASQLVSSGAQALTQAEIANLKGADREQILVEGAKKEGKVVIWSSLDTDVHHAQLKAFSRKFPGLAIEAFKISGDPTKYPEQIAEGLAPWQPKRIVGRAGGGHFLELRTQVNDLVGMVARDFAAECLLDRIGLGGWLEAQYFVVCLHGGRDKRNRRRGSLASGSARPDRSAAPRLPRARSS